MSEEKKEESCGSSKGCGCCKGTKLLIGLLIGVFIFASGMWFAKSHCHYYRGGEKICPFSAPVPPAK
jgi:hypothetical protein